MANPPIAQVVAELQAALRQAEAAEAREASQSSQEAIAGELEAEEQAVARSQQFLEVRFAEAHGLSEEYEALCAVVKKEEHAMALQESQVVALKARKLEEVEERPAEENEARADL